VRVALLVLLVAGCSQRRTPRAKLNDKEFKVRRQAVMELVEAGDRDGLVLGMQHPDEPTRIFAAVGYLALGEKPATSAPPQDSDSDAALTPNPSKAPADFLGPVDMLVYADPSLAGKIGLAVETCMKDANPRMRWIAEAAFRHLDERGGLRRER